MKKSEIVFVLAVIACFGTVVRYGGRLADGGVESVKSIDKVPAPIARHASIKVISKTGVYVNCISDGRKVTFVVCNVYKRDRLHQGKSYNIDYKEGTRANGDHIYTIYKIHPD